MLRCVVTTGEGFNGQCATLYDCVVIKSIADDQLWVLRVRTLVNHRYRLCFEYINFQHLLQLEREFEKDPFRNILFTLLVIQSIEIELYALL